MEQPAKKKLLVALRCLLMLIFIVNTIGCEAFVRKFTRKPKKDLSEENRMVVTPEEYPAPVVTKEEAYRHSLLYWQSWHDELIGALSATNQKKQLGCADEAIKNLEELKIILPQEKQPGLGHYIAQLQSLRSAIAVDYTFTNASRNRQDAERIKRGILQHFSVKHVKGDLS
jgi:hypothetical protein